MHFFKHLHLSSQLPLIFIFLPSFLPSLTLILPHHQFHFFPSEERRQFHRASLLLTCKRPTKAKTKPLQQEIHFYFPDLSPGVRPTGPGVHFHARSGSKSARTRQMDKQVPGASPTEERRSLSPQNVSLQECPLRYVLPATAKWAESLSPSPCPFPPLLLPPSLHPLSLLRL